MRPIRYHIVAGDWGEVERALNFLSNRLVSQELTAISVPTFAGLTLTGMEGVLKATAGVVSGSAVHSDLGSIGANDHHAQIHGLVSSDHTVSGLTAGHVLKALTPTTFGFAAAGYLESETDPVFSAWDKSTGISITESQISDLQDYYKEGDSPLFVDLTLSGANITTPYEAGDEVLQENCETNLSATGAFVKTSTWSAQTFVPSEDFAVTRVELYLKRSAGATGTLTIGIRETSEGKPIGEDLCYGTYNIASLGTGFTWKEIVFNEEIALTSGITYSIVVRAIDASDYAIGGLSGSPPAYANGTLLTSVNSGSSWSINDLYDWYFRVYGKGDITYPDLNINNCQLNVNAGLKIGTLTGLLRADSGIVSVEEDTYLTEETDPYAVLADGTRELSANWDAGNFNITAQGFIGESLRLNEAAEPASIADTLAIYASDKNGFTVLQGINGGGETFQFLRDNWQIVRNVTGSDIASCKIVCHAGTVTGNIANIKLAKADSATTMPAIGITIDAIANNGFGRVMFIGSLTCDTNAFNEGDTLYVSAAAAGEAVSAAPTFPNFRQEIGQVLVKGVGNGKVDVDVRTARGTEYYDDGYLRLNGSNANQNINIGAYNLTTTGTLGAGAITGTSLDTGQGAYELYAMNQNVLTTSNVIFDNLTLDNLLVNSTLGNELVTNGGTFTSGWTYATPPWQLVTGKMRKNADGTGTLSQTVPVTAGEYYTLSYVISTWTVGTVTASIGGVTLDIAGADGTYTRTFKAVSTAGLVFTPTNTSRFYLDDVSVKKTDGRIQGGALWLDGVAGGVPTSGAGTRLMWIPDKVALRAGSVLGTEWDSANIGTGSIALGRNLMASGVGAIAIGSAPGGAYGIMRATGAGAITLGYVGSSQEYAIMEATNEGSFAGGYINAGESNATMTSSGKGSFGYGFMYNDIGSGSFVVSGTGAVGLGYCNSYQSNANLLISGTGAFGGGYIDADVANAAMTVNGSGAFGWGYVQDGTFTVNGNGAVGIGSSTSVLTAVGAGAISIGTNNQVNNDYSTAIGTGNNVSNLYSQVIGFSNLLTGQYNTGLGVLLNMTGNVATAVGYDLDVFGEGGLALGRGTTAGTFVVAGKNAVGIGHDVLSLKEESFTFGADVSNNITQMMRFGVGDPILDLQAGSVNLYGNTLIADVTDLGAELIVNGTFTGNSTGWTLPAGWSYSGNMVRHNTDGTGALTQTTPITIVAGKTYYVEWDSSIQTVGSYTMSLGGVTSEAYGYVGHFQEIITATNTDSIAFTPTNTARFYLDNVTVKEITGGDLNVLGTITAKTGLVIPSGTTPAPATVGALFLDTDASANGDLMIYANGDWRKIISLP